MTRVLRCSALSSCAALMSTSLMSTLLLHRHRKASVFICLPSSFSPRHCRILHSASAPSSVLQEAHKQDGFLYQFIRVWRSFSQCHPLVRANNTVRGVLLTNFITGKTFPSLSCRAWRRLCCARTWPGSPLKCCSGTKMLDFKGV